MKVTKENIIKEIKKQTGLDVGIEKHENEYYWTGKTSSLFDQRCTHYTKLNHPNISLNSFVDDFIFKVQKLEKEFNKPIDQILNSIDWNI
tara:strand:+ start:448 stop:717 length:270 start_codon:yes stop_codon:yes gene_type:complete